MIRTRDFVVFLGLLFSLVISGGAVAVLDIGGQNNQFGAAAAAFDPGAVPVAEKEAVVPPAPELDREGLLSEMRDKVASRIKDVGALVVTESEPPVEVGEDGPVASDEDVGVQQCATYSEVAWSDMPGALFKEVEGARVLYRPVAVTAPPPPIATGTDSLPLVNDEVLVQLPLRTAPLPSTTCIPQDVVGIALDGSLIRNDEVALYKVFGSDTLIGYTLDGFPLYGISALPTDDCGGAMVGGTYRYYLSNERKTIVQCFAGVPVGL